MTIVSLFLVIILAFLLGRTTIVMYHRLKRRLTFATTIGFAAAVCFALLLYFFVVSVFLSPEAHSDYQYLLQRISWVGSYWSYILFTVLGLFSFLLLIIEQLSSSGPSD